MRDAEFAGAQPLDQSVIDSTVNKPDFGAMRTAFNQAEGFEMEANKKRAADAAELRRSSQEAYDVANQPVPRPNKPKLQDLPAPPDPQPKDPAQAMGSVLGSVALLLSLTARKPLTAGLKAAAGVMQGDRQGQKELADYQYKRFQAAMQEAQAQNQKEMQEYNVELENSRISADEKLARLHALAIKHNDTAAAQQMELSGIEGMKDLMLKRASMEETLQVQEMHWDYQRRNQRSAVTTAQAQQNQAILQARSYIQNLDPKQQKLLAGLEGKSSFELTVAEQQLLAAKKLSEKPLFGGEGQAAQTQTQSSPGQPPAPGAVPIPAGHEGEPDGTTFNGGKYVKQGKWAVPVGAASSADDTGSSMPDMPLANNAAPF